jgi:hypothetical protein
MFGSNQYSIFGTEPEEECFYFFIELSWYLHVSISVGFQATSSRAEGYEPRCYIDFQ